MQIEGGAKKRSKRDLFLNKQLQKGTCDLSYAYVHIIFTLLLIKQIFEKKITDGSARMPDTVWLRSNPDK